MTLESALIVAVGALASVVVTLAGKLIADNKQCKAERDGWDKERKELYDRYMNLQELRRTDQVAAADAVIALRAELRLLNDASKGRP